MGAILGVIGVLGAIPQSSGTAYGIGSLMVILTFGYNIGIGPTCELLLVVEDIVVLPVSIPRRSVQTFPYRHSAIPAICPYFILLHVSFFTPGSLHHLLPHLIYGPC
jgi:hypothetical protein